MHGRNKVIGHTRTDVVAQYRELGCIRDPDCFTPDPKGSDEELLDSVKWDEGAHDWYLDYETRSSAGRDIATVLWMLALLVPILMFVTR